MRFWIEVTSCYVALSVAALVAGDCFEAALFGGAVVFQSLCLFLGFKLFPE